MKTIICPKCGKTISDDSNSCIYCGISRNLIDEMSLTDKLEKQGKIKHKSKNKKLIIFIEVVLLILIVAVYYKLFIPQILDYTETEKQANRIKSCEEDYNGKWNYELDACDTEDIGTIEIQ